MDKDMTKIIETLKGKGNIIIMEEPGHIEQLALNAIRVLFPEILKESN